MPLIPIAPDARKGKPPCGECHIRPGETCDICGAKQEPEPRPFQNAPQGHDASQTTSLVRPVATASTSTVAAPVVMRNGSDCNQGLSDAFAQTPIPLVLEAALAAWFGSHRVGTAPPSHEEWVAAQPKMIAALNAAALVQSADCSDAEVSSGAPWNWRWDDKDDAGHSWGYDRADLLLGKMSLGSYSRWDEENLRREDADVSRPIHAWVKQAIFIDGKPNHEPDGWFATAAEARAFVENEVDKMLREALAPV